MAHRHRLALEALEARSLLDSGLASILVNDPTQDTTAQDTQSETAIVLGANSKVIVAYNDSVGMIAGDNYHAVGYSRSNNGGATFQEMGSLPVNPHHDHGDPTLARSAKTGTVFLSTMGVDSVTANPSPPPPLQWSGFEQIDVFRSTNNGASFRQPANATPGYVADVDYTDKPWIAVDNFPGPDGSGYGNVYLVTRHSNQVSGNWTFDLRLTRSTDDGVTFGPTSGTTIVPPGDNTFHGPNVTVGSDHAVYVFWWNADKFDKWATNPKILMRKSTDQGVTFGDPVTVTGLKTNAYGGDLGLVHSGNHYFATNAFPQAAVNPVTGDIYVAFDDWGNSSYKKDRADVYFTQSTDGGQHWSKPVQVNDDQTNNDQWFPALAVTPDGGHVGLFWYDCRLDPANNLIDRFGAIGAVSCHTVTFGANFRITDVSFPPASTYWDGSAWQIQDPVIRPFYMGDYDQAVADNAYFYTAWGDNRLSDAFHANQPDVRFAKVPVNWTGESSKASVALAAARAPVVGSTDNVSFGEVPWDRYAVGALPLDVSLTNLGASSKKAPREPAIDVVVYGPPTMV
jgi:hypothetical protein